VEGPRHAGNDYAGERFIAQHGSGTLLSTRGVILRLEPNRSNRQAIF
jgi:hypothetical protein